MEPSLIHFDEMVPARHLWLEGDNRRQSADSRVFLNDPDGMFIPTSSVVAVMVDE